MFREGEGQFWLGRVKSNRVGAVLPVALIQFRRDAIDGVSDGISNIKVAGVADFSSSGRESRYRYNP